ncbi:MULTISPECIES: hypothetical protein [Methylorubrum]|uniref:hypothetical protein n=1 Tax=Methylorubrum TaxID=2282523 RepID=UPI00209E5108|nr:MULTISPECIES: hypothetical protein [Methylorubrum]MCP1548440.1 hypothetical protein [Methylorubrum zatmanii]MCP1554945.1 hypothetical protein [Methylorubrum extorquens]MCP1578743.1 hypothetical protein [Methylorubrum extorquens]
MAYDFSSRPNRRRAAALFESLKGELIDASEAVERPATMQAATSSPHWRLSNVAGVHLYETARGWNADIAFEDLPVGVPTIIGNAVPCTTRQEALQSAIRNLSLCAEREKTIMANFDTTMRWFVFDDIEVPVDPGYLPGIAAKLEREGCTHEDALGRLAYLRHVISGDEPMTKEAVEAADDEIRERLAVDCEIAMALGRTQFSLTDGVWADYAPAASGLRQ